MAWRELGLTGKPIFYRTNNPVTRSLVRKNFTSGHTHDVSVDVTNDRQHRVARTVEIPVEPDEIIARQLP